MHAISFRRRRIQNIFLGYLTCIETTPEEQSAATAFSTSTSHYQLADGMIDKVAALSTLAYMDGEGAEYRDAALLRFYDEAIGNILVLNK